MDQVKRLCPMTFPSGEAQKCIKENCAWWHDRVYNYCAGVEYIETGCAIIKIYNSLSDINESIIEK